MKIVESKIIPSFTFPRMMYNPPQLMSNKNMGSLITSKAILKIFLGFSKGNSLYPKRIVRSLTSSVLNPFFMFQFLRVKFQKMKTRRFAEVVSLFSKVRIISEKRKRNYEELKDV